MKQSTLYPLIRLAYREELENRLDQFVPKLLSILDCGLKSTETPHYCKHCIENGIEPGTNPCKYLLVDAKNLLTVFKKRIEIFEALETPDFKYTMGTMKRTYKELQNMFSSGLYSEFVEKELLGQITANFFERVKKTIKFAKKKAKKPTTEVPKSKSLLEGIVSFMHKYRPEVTSKLDLPQKSELRSMGKKEFIGKISQRSVEHWKESLKRMKDWYETEMSTFVEIKNIAEISSIHTLDPEPKREHRSVKVVTRGERLKEEEIRLYYFAPLKGKSLERERIERKVEELGKEVERRKYLFTHAGAKFTLDAFSVYSNPIQKYRLLQDHMKILKRRKNTLESERSTIYGLIRNLDKCIYLRKGRPTNLIRNPSHSFWKFEEILTEIMSKLEEKKRSLEGEKLKPDIRLLKKKRKRKRISQEERRLNNWVKKEVREHDLIDKLKTTWKLSREIKKVDGIISGVRKEQEELDVYLPKILYSPVEQNKTPMPRFVEQGPLDLYIK